MLRAWKDLPDFMQIPEVQPYYEALKRKSLQLSAKRTLDILLAVILLILFLIPMFLIMIWIVLDSPGSPIFRQERVTTFGRRFRIHKFRTMSLDSDKTGGFLTTKDDLRITKAGNFLRRFHLDEPIYRRH